MVGKYKLIGVCTTKVHDESCTIFLQELFRSTVGTDYRMLIFNSFYDFYHGDEYDKGASSVYSIINYDVLDAIVIDDKRFFDKSIVNHIVAEAHKRLIPVLLLSEKREGCFSFDRKPEPAYKSLIRHVIEEHNAKKLYFIAGIKGEENTEFRLKCFRDVMNEHGLPCGDDVVFYGEYWDYPVYKIIDMLVSGRNIPDAFICANDSMAVAACDQLKRYGIKVPDDVIITGYDGLASVAYHNPRISTCEYNLSDLGASCFKMITDAIENHADPYTLEKKYSVKLSESCGCEGPNDLSYRDTASKLYALVHEMKEHEEVIYSWADKILDSTDLSIIGQNLYEHILAGSAVALNSDFLATVRKGIPTDPEHPFSNKMVVISCRKNDYTARNQEVFDLEEMSPDFLEGLEEPIMMIFQSIFVGPKVCGYYIVKTPDIEYVAHKLHRVSRVMNIGFSTIVSRIEREHMTQGMSEDKARDPLTGLLTLVGLREKLEQDEKEFTQKHFAISIYNMPRYKFISDNYGSAAIDEAVCLVTEALRMSNPKESLIARIADDTFAIVNLESSGKAISNIINDAVKVFFGITGTYQQSKEYFVEVNCGCYNSKPGWKATELSLYIQAATQELQRNRVIYGTLPAVKSGLPGERYRLFDTLIKKNLFTYHFQPIVDARTGDICAYEALMRTAPEIGMNPGEVISVAKEYNRLYDIERATLFNVMEYIDTHHDEFGERRIFINIIPGNFLRKKDNRMLHNMYEHIFPQCTLEITELNEVTDENLDVLANSPLFEVAIDDYGTGFSNIVSLLRFRPQVLKIDRYLITDIHTDVNKQMFVKSTIEFAQMNNIKVLAEGVETIDELNAVIEYGVDLIQGFYTARPEPKPLDGIPEKIRAEIISANERRVEPLKYMS